MTEERLERMLLAENGESVADGLLAIAKSLDRVASALRALGNADAATPMGAIEALGAVIKEGADRVANALGEIADRP